MDLSRRTFGGLLAAASTSAVVMPTRCLASPEGLRAAAGMAQLAPFGQPETAVWGYDAGVPGPVLRVRQGDRVARRLVNDLPQPTTVHWHGIRIDNAMDGVPDITQAAVEPGGWFDYAFVVPDAGTYWYHPHNRAWEQMARGLYGALIVEEPEPSDVDRDEVLLLDDWRLTETAAIDESFGALHDWAHAGRLGNWITVNGSGEWQTEVKSGDRLRLRLVNTANALIFQLRLHGFEGWVVALDGQPLLEPEPVGSLILGPAQRADLAVDVTGEDEAFLLSEERDGAYAIATFAIASGGGARLGPPTPLAPNPLIPIGDVGRAREVVLTMAGGAMGTLESALMDGQERSLRDLAAAGKVWAFNGMAEMPEEPLIEAARGETVLIRMVNDTAWPHAMHLHGHHFRQVREGGLGPWRDTILMDRGETATIALVADNPGDWLLHCHMLEHSAAGMMTWLRVV